jgi:hypothetical protein
VIDDSLIHLSWFFWIMSRRVFWRLNQNQRYWESWSPRFNLLSVFMNELLCYQLILYLLVVVLLRSHYSMLLWIIQEPCCVHWLILFPDWLFWSMLVGVSKLELKLFQLHLSVYYFELFVISVGCFYAIFRFAKVCFFFQKIRK